MKKLILVAAIAVSGCNNESTNGLISKVGVDTAYHIKAKHWHECKWQVVFTKGGLSKEENLNRCFDLSMNGFGNDVVKMKMIFDNEAQAVSFARNFKTYEMCRSWNDSIDREFVKMIEYRDLHPCTERVEPDSPPCKDDEGKEILVY